MRWLRKFAGKPSEDDSKGAGQEKASVGDPFELLPFEITVPPRWRVGLFDGSTPMGVDGTGDAAFAAHDPESADPDYFATIVIFWREPVEDADAHLADQEREFRSGFESNLSAESYSLDRVTLPAGEALRLVIIHGEAQVQYYLPTSAGLFAIWFTAPLEERIAREAEFASIAESFRLKEGQRP